MVMVISWMVSGKADVVLVTFACPAREQPNFIHHESNQNLQRQLCCGLHCSNACAKEALLRGNVHKAGL